MARSSEPLQDHRAFDWLAVQAASRVVAQVRPEHLDQPSPCDGWRVRDLLRHMVGNNRGFAAAARGAVPDRALWDGLDLDSGADLTHEWARSADDVTRAFALLTRPEDTLSIPGYGEPSAAQAVRMHFIDFLVHGWDLAVSIGVDADLDDEACREVLRIAARWPQGHPDIWGPGAPFGTPVEVPPGATPAHRMLGLLGRSPSWWEQGRPEFWPAPARASVRTDVPDLPS
jgi:uncharacterized protein (TIGR03086 family)